MADDTGKSTNSNDSSDAGASPNADRDGDNSAPDGVVGESSEREIGGRTGPDPTRYGDWEKDGRCIDF